MHQEPDFNEITKEWHGSMNSYVIGLIVSFLLTITAFLVAWARASITREVVIFTLIGLAAAQATAQVLFFLHVGEEPKPRWETLIFLFTVLVLFVIVIGSLWIMSDLDKRVMTM